MNQCSTPTPEIGILHENKREIEIEIEIATFWMQRRSLNFSLLLLQSPAILLKPLDMNAMDCARPDIRLYYDEHSIKVRDAYISVSCYSCLLALGPQYIHVQGRQCTRTYSLVGRTGSKQKSGVRTTQDYVRSFTSAVTCRLIDRNELTES